MVAEIAQAVGPWWVVIAALVAILGVGRLARLLTYDTFPPAYALRQWWYGKTKDREDNWKDLLFCPFCIAPWLTLLCLGHFALGYTAPWIAWSWWLFWGWLALAYVAAIVVSYDQPDEK